MENTEGTTVKRDFMRGGSLFTLVFFFIVWRPGFIASETLTLTTYYPAPYGGYASLLTTGQTLLARDGGRVGIGLGPGGLPTAKLHVAGTFRLVDGTQAVGKVLTSDANGLASWADSGMKCKAESYSSGGVTTCTGGANVILAAMDATGRLYPLGPETSVPQSGTMLCCKI
ncbi:MAG: hypothetical protein A2X28_00440 [Elusimicrobia bacterium GWA2_56_46]|nr:MAG: hypothetical protein A2X28_00440 [Elusimicrobia bacterium GWA2_56_46]OGR55836.1 MAG: hypothetical protein A2X39_05815 [Elusimicrobia bacterium GWC2_56_31]HBB65820.1 hypothetical protein [Elusimicrobiota bacterium]HBW22232.1 hypothetical protein [Elusimicrobiota bacterium]